MAKKANGPKLAITLEPPAAKLYTHEPYGCEVPLTPADLGGSAVPCPVCRRYDAPEKFVAKDED